LHKTDVINKIFHKIILRVLCSLLYPLSVSASLRVKYVFIAAIVTFLSICPQFANVPPIRDAKVTADRAETALGWCCVKTSRRNEKETDEKSGSRVGRTPDLGTCPFSDASGALATGIQSNLQSFRALGRVLVPGLLTSKQRLHGLHRDARASIRRRRRGRRGHHSHPLILSLSLSPFLSLRRESLRREN